MTLKIQLPIKSQDQAFAGFLIESMEGVAIHSQGMEPDHLCLIYDSTCQAELDCFLQAWNSFFQSGSKMAFSA